MAFSNLKSNLIKIFITFFMLQNHNVKSQQQSSSSSPSPSPYPYPTPSHLPSPSPSPSPSVPPLSQSETASFTVATFEKDDPDLIFKGDASASHGILRLTKTNQFNNPFPNSVGKAAHITPIHIWDKNNGNLAGFTTTFSFIVNTINGPSKPHGDGFTFFISPLHIDLPANSSGGYLGLLGPQTALDPSKNQIVAVEFDSFLNDWDPSILEAPHIGIDVGSLYSTQIVAWPIDYVAKGALGVASINYNSEAKRLSVFVGYPGTNYNATVAAIVDLRTVLPEWVRVGFSAATGVLVETHDIINWSFDAAL